MYSIYNLICCKCISFCSISDSRSDLLKSSIIQAIASSVTHVWFTSILSIIWGNLWTQNRGLRRCPGWPSISFELVNSQSRVSNFPWRCSNQQFGCLLFHGWGHHPSPVEWVQGILPRKTGALFTQIPSGHLDQNTDKSRRPIPKHLPVAGHCRVPHCVNICCWESLLSSSVDSDYPQKPFSCANCEQATDCQPEYKVRRRSRSGWSGEALHREEKQEDSKSHCVKLKCETNIQGCDMKHDCDLFTSAMN